MNKTEARAILAQHLREYREKAYADLLYLLHEQDNLEVAGPSGTWYQLEFLAVWDDRQEANLRVIGSIDDGGVRAFFPLTDGFIMAPDGSLVGE